MNENGKGASGPLDPRMRGDARVEVEITGSVVTLDVRSKVAGMYGEAIESDVRRTLEECGVSGAKVVVDDRGALPTVLRARVECAARRAGGHAPQLRAVELPPATVRDRTRRSRLYLPGNSPKFMINAGLHGADGLIFDLEDSVHPDEKDAARILVRNVLREWSYPGVERMVRINPGEMGLADLEELATALPELLLLPKVESPEEVNAVAERVHALAGDERPVWLMPILETALGIERALEIATAHDSVVALTLGLEDLTADLGVPKTDDGAETSYARSRVVMAAHAARVQPIDSVYGNVGDEDGLRRWATRSRAMGFSGMGCVHPRQIPVLHECFAPSVAEVEKARAIVAAFEQAQAQGRAVVSLGSRMIDPPVVKRARKIVDQLESSNSVADRRSEGDTE